MQQRSLFLFSLLILLSLGPSMRAEIPENFQRENLVAWCVVPFDALKRNPVERAEMLAELGLKRCAYDWRQEHVPTFEEEILEYQKQGIEFFAFWNEHDAAFRLFEQYEMHPQIWKTLRTPKAETQEAKIAEAVRVMKPLAEKAQAMGSKLGLYNHGGWGGEPANMIAVCEALHAMGYDNVGIVYNFHHAHFDRDAFLEVFDQLKPHLLCLNLNGVLDPEKVDVTKMENKVRPIGSGEYEKAMIQKVIESGYEGPIGVLGHLSNEDVRIVLERNLVGLEMLLEELRASP